MFNPTQISTALSGLIGFRQPFNPQYAILDADNISSKSGLFVTDNEFCKVEYLKDSQDFVDISDANFNLYLKNKQKESIISVCNSVFNETSFRERNLFYKRATNRVNIETLPIGFVGYRIIPTIENNLAILVKRVICEFQGTGSFTLMCFNTAKKDPLFTKYITITTDNQIVDLDWTLDNTVIYGGEYYIGYINNGLTINPFKRDWNSSNIITEFCDIQVLPIYANHLTNQLFDLTTIQGNSQNFGINLDVTTFDDYTDLICNNDLLFAKAINYDLQISCLSTYLASLRSNANERNADRTASRILAEIEGMNNEGVAKVTGLRTLLFKSIANIRKEIKSLQIGYLGDVIQNTTLC